MKAMKKNLKKLICLFTALSTVLCNGAYASVIVKGGIDSFYDTGPGFTSELVVAGDSYAQHFYKDEHDRDIRMYLYSQEGQTLEENWKLMTEAFNSFYKLIFLSISVNERQRNTHPSVFEAEFRQLLEMAKNTGKIVLLHSYMYYDLASVPVFQYTTFEYDAMIRKIIMDYDNVYFIDMSDCVGVEYMLPDMIHYNKKFNDVMYDRVKMMFDLIREKYHG